MVLPASYRQGVEDPGVTGTRPSRYGPLSFRASLPLCLVALLRTPARRWTVALQANVHQGLHGEGFIYAMSCAAGLTKSKMNLDLDGVDWQIAYPGPKGTARSPKIEMQVKSWSNPVLEEGTLSTGFRSSNYNKLPEQGFNCLDFWPW